MGYIPITIRLDIEYFSGRRFIAAAVLFVIAIVVILIGRNLRKVEDDDEVRKMGKGMVIGGKVFLVVDVVFGLIKWGIYLLESDS